MKTKFKRLPLESLVNIRDLGGFPTADGRVTKYGRFIRSELPRYLSANDLDFLRNYGLVLTLDFRNDSEAQSEPSFLSDNKVEWQRYVRNSLKHDRQAAHDRVNDDNALHGLPPIEVFSKDWAEVYIDIAETNREWVKQNMELISGIEGCTLFHCMTGKDRTGIFSALLLALCGCSDADIIADYSVSQVHLRPFYLTLPLSPAYLSADGEPDLSLNFYQTRPDTMYRFLRYLSDTYGSINRYLDSCDISPSVLERIINTFVEDIE